MLTLHLIELWPDHRKLVSSSHAMNSTFSLLGPSNVHKLQRLKGKSCHRNRDSTNNLAQMLEMW